MSERYRVESQQRILRVLLILGGHEVNGLSPGEIGQSLQLQPSTVTRDLANLQIAGLAERIAETGRWRLAPRLVQVAMAYLNQVDQAQSKLDEIRNRYTRHPH